MIRVKEGDSYTTLFTKEGLHQAIVQAGEDLFLISKNSYYFTTLCPATETDVNISYSDFNKKIVMTSSKILLISDDDSIEVIETADAASVKDAKLVDVIRNDEGNKQYFFLMPDETIKSFIRIKTEDRGTLYKTA